MLDVEDISTTEGPQFQSQNRELEFEVRILKM